MKEMFPHVFRKYANYEYLGFQKEVGEHVIYRMYFRYGAVTVHCTEHVWEGGKQC